MVTKILGTLAVLSAVAALVGASIRSPFPQIWDWRDRLYGLSVLGALAFGVGGIISAIWS